MAGKLRLKSSLVKQVPADLKAVKDFVQGASLLVLGAQIDRA